MAIKNIILLRTKGMVVPCLLLIDSYMKWLAVVMKHYLSSGLLYHIMMVYFSIIINRRLLRGIAKGPPVVGCHCIQLSRYAAWTWHPPSNGSIPIILSYSSFKNFQL